MLENKKKILPALICKSSADGVALKIIANRDVLVRQKIQNHIFKIRQHKSERHGDRYISSMFIRQRLIPTKYSTSIVMKIGSSKKYYRSSMFCTRKYSPYTILKMDKSEIEASEELIEENNNNNTTIWKTTLNIPIKNYINKVNIDIDKII